MDDGKLMMIRCGVGFPHCGDNIPGVICYVCGMYLKYNLKNYT